MELKPNMYVRTLDGISKVIEVIDNGVMTRFVNENCNIYFINEMLCDPSYEVIDLIEVGDYVNGEYVTNVVSNHSYIGISREFIMIKEKDIKSIVTKEQFESMSYKVGD